jgi:DNA-binding transcriptional LysR family regulator
VANVDADKILFKSLFSIDDIDMSDIRNIDLNLLFVLHVLLQENNVSKAAIRLHLTQPTVSGMLARLRELFKDPLFVRKSHGLQATSRGLSLREPLAQILGEIEALTQTSPFDPAVSTKTFSLSSNDYMQYVLLTPAIRALQKSVPYMRFAVRPPEISSLYEKLVADEIDMAVTIPEFSDARLREQVLYREEYVAVIRKGHPAGKTRLTLKRFLELEHAIVSPTGGQFIGPTDLVLAQQKKRRNVTVSVSSFFALIELVALGEHIALLPRRLAEKFSDRLQLLKPPLSVPGFDVILAWHPKTDSDPARRWLVESLETFVTKTMRS